VGRPVQGKTTTLAALIDEINRRDPKHIITIEDPIEYEHPQQKSVVGADRDRHRCARISSQRCVPRCGRLRM
jgi:Tfp pilus assembly pilus retraction ATPase PilT